MALLSDIIGRGLHSARPAAGTAGKLYYETDTTTLFRDNGSSWDSVEGAGGMTNPMTTAGDIIKGGSSGTPARLAIGSSGDVLTVSGGVPVWSAPSGGSATILARYTRTTAQSIANNSSTIVDYATSVRDTNSAVATGASWHFTAPSTADYTVIAALIFDVTATWGDGEIATLELWKNGSAYSTLDWKDNNGGTGYKQLSGSDTVRLTAGDTLAIHVLQLSGGSLNLLNSGQYNFVNIYSLP